MDVIILLLKVSKLLHNEDFQSKSTPKTRSRIPRYRVLRALGGGRDRGPGAFVQHRLVSTCRVSLLWHGSAEFRAEDRFTGLRLEGLMLLRGEQFNLWELEIVFTSLAFTA